MLNQKLMCYVTHIKPNGTVYLVPCKDQGTTGFHVMPSWFFSTEVRNKLRIFDDVEIQYQEDSEGAIWVPINPGGVYAERYSQQEAETGATGNEDGEVQGGGGRVEGGVGEDPQ